MPARVRMRWTAYAGVSTVLAGFVILKSLAQRPNFYSAAVYLSQSSANLMILTNLVFVTACTFLFGLQKLLYGPLRPIEIEQLYEKAWFAVTETCLAMTIFRGEVGPWFLIMFFSLLAGKVWGWIGEGRVEILEQQPPRNPRLFHTRLALSLGLGVAFNMSMLHYIVNQVLRMARPDMMVMFGFEFAILTIISFSTALRYAISLFEIGILRDQKRIRGEEMRKERMESAKRALDDAERRIAQTPDHTEQLQSTLTVDDARVALRRAEQPVDENEIEVEGWENKGRWVFYLDLATDFCKLVTYLSFFFILLVFYGLPIHIMRDVFLTTRSFFKRIADFMKYRTATRDMNERYPDASADEIGREDVCIICREEMRPYQPPAAGQPPHNPAIERMRPKKLPCGHILHFSCLRSWLERQQVCPTCRRPVVPTTAGATAAAAAPGAQIPPGQRPPGERPGPRVFQFGPLRIGVGAARGNNMFEELQQQLADGRAAPAAQGNHNGPQQYGFGIRWEGRRQRRRQREQGPIREQLDSIEQQIQQQVQALTQDYREYAMLRAMQIELDRIRSARNNPGSQAAAGPPAASGTPAVGARPAQVLHAGPGTQILQAGNEQLPAGLTLPEGWTMMPLHPAGAPVVSGSIMPSTVRPVPNSQDRAATMNTGPQAATVASPQGRATNAQHNDTNANTGVSDHIRAMFTMPDRPAPATIGTSSNGAISIGESEQTHQAPSSSTTEPQGELIGSSPSTSAEDRPKAAESTSALTNGAPANHTASISSTIGQPRPPSLPSWGSEPNVPPTDDSSGKGKQKEQQDEADEHALANASGRENSSGGSKHATVEDLVEDPD